jgi:hypothetical protein
MGDEEGSSKERWLSRLKLPTGAFVISVVAFLSSQLSCFLSFRTHSLTQRPYLGVEDAHAHMHEGTTCDSASITWNLTFKNVGPTPVRLLVHEHKLTLKQGTEVYFDHPEGPGNSVRLLPDATNVMSGHLACEMDSTPYSQQCRAVLCHVRVGTAEAIVKVRLTYWGPGWLYGERPYNYEAEFQYQPRPQGEGLLPLRMDAD